MTGLSYLWVRVLCGGGWGGWLRQTLSPNHQRGGVFRQGAAGLVSSASPTLFLPFSRFVFALAQRVDFYQPSPEPAHLAVPEQHNAAYGLNVHTWRATKLLLQLGERAPRGPASKRAL